MMTSGWSRPAEQGLSLVEMLLAVILVGIMSIIMSPSFSMLASSSKLSYAAQQTVVNQEMARALEEYARNRTDSINGQSQAGRLPQPVTIPATNQAQAVPHQVADWTSNANSQLLTDMLEQGVPQDQLWSDGTAAHRARMYVVTPSSAPLTQNVPLYFQSGPLVTITYDFGALYMTTCSANLGGACDPNNGGSLASGGASDSGSNLLTQYNYTKWTTQTPDYPATYVTTLPVQMDMLHVTAQRLDRVRDAMLNYFKTKQLGAAANDNTNWYPLPTTGYATSKPLLNPLNYQGCVDNWIDLSSTDVLPQIGLTQAEYGHTAWGGTVEYCPQFDGTTTGQMYNGTGPFVYYGALRINKSVTGGAPPNTANVSYTAATDSQNGINVILTF